MTDAITYNGWTNYETWLVGLWFNDSFDETDAATLTPDAFQRTVEDYIDMTGTPGTGFVADALTGFLSPVNWRELTDHVREAHFITENEGA